MSDDYETLGGDDNSGDYSRAAAPVRQVPRGKPYPGPSPLLTGLINGGAASLVMGPLGLLVGLGTGIVAGRMKSSYLDNQARFLREATQENYGLQDAASKEMQADSNPVHQRMIQSVMRMADAGWQRLQNGDGTGRDMINRANELLTGIQSANYTQQLTQESSNQQFHRGLITTAANSYRDLFQQNEQTANAADQLSGRVFGLTSEKGFDPNKPFNKAILADLLTMGVNGYYKDAPSILQGLAEGAPGIGTVLGAFGGPIGAAGGAAVGEVLKGVSTAITSNELKLTAEDYNRVAMNLRKYALAIGQKRIQQLSDASQQLDAYAKKAGALPDDFSLTDYVSGTIKELKFLPVPAMPAGNAGDNIPPMLRRPNGQPPVSSNAPEWMKWLENKSDQTTTDLLQQPLLDESAGGFQGWWNQVNNQMNQNFRKRNGYPAAARPTN